MIRLKLLIAPAIIASVGINACSDVTAPKKPLPAGLAAAAITGNEGVVRQEEADNDRASSPRSGALHATKECSGFTGLAGSFCTITSSSLKEIKVGSRVVYLQPASNKTPAGSDVILYAPGPGNNTAFGHCSTFVGLCTFSGGTGNFTGFHASVVVTHVGGLNWAWNGTYSFSDKGTFDFTTIDVPGASTTLALDINAGGVIVGRYVSAGKTHGFMRSKAGEFTTIDFPGSVFTTAVGTNRRGDIVGTYSLPASPTVRHGYLRRNGQFSSIDPPGSNLTTANGINDRGDIVGRFCTLATCVPLPGNGDFHGFLLREGEYTTIDFPGSRETNAFKIIDGGQIVGGYGTPDGRELPFVSRKGKFTSIALPGGMPISQDNGGINARGDIVGIYCDGAPPCFAGAAGTHGYVLSGGDFTTIDVPGAAATSAVGINARREIVGYSFDASGSGHGYLVHWGQRDGR